MATIQKSAPVAAVRTAVRASLFVRVVDHPFAQRMWDGLACVFFWLAVTEAVCVPLCRFQIMEHRPALLTSLLCPPLLAMLTLIVRIFRDEMSFLQGFAVAIGILIAMGESSVLLWLAREAF